MYKYMRTELDVDSICASLELPFYSSFRLIFFWKKKRKNKQCSMKEKTKLAVVGEKKIKN